MTRTRLTALLAARAPGRDPASDPPAEPAAPRRERRRGAARPGQAGVAIPLIGMSGHLQPGQALGLADAVLRRILDCGCPVSTVILDLSAAAEIDGDGCAALRSLHASLASIGTRLRIATSAVALRTAFTENGVTRLLGPDAIHRDLRAAILATCAEFPGPGLVTERVRDLLTLEPEPLAFDCRPAATEAAALPAGPALRDALAAGAAQAAGAARAAGATRPGPPATRLTLKPGPLSPGPLRPVP